MAAPPWSPSADEFQRLFAEQNPWHATGVVPVELAREVERPLARHLWRRLLSDSPLRYQLVLGPRRAGKTTAMYQTVRHLIREGVEPKRLWWTRLDHPLFVEIPLAELVAQAIRGSAATSERPLFLMLDELAYARQWDLWLKTFYDERYPLRIIASSSATAALRGPLLESGVGRWEERYLAPCLLTEYLELSGRAQPLVVGETLHATLLDATRSTLPLHEIESARLYFTAVGGFPELLSEEPGPGPSDWVLRSQRVLRGDAVERAIYKDIPQSFGVEDPMKLERLLYVLAAQMTGILSPTRICKELDLTQPTFDKYVSYLERSFLVFTLPNFSESEIAVQRKRGRKLYFVDAAVRNAALLRGFRPFQDQAEMGLVLENLAASHLHALAQQEQVRLFHWRDGDREVDLVYNHPEHPMAFEISASPAHDRRGLRALLDRHPRFEGRSYLVAPGAPAIAPGPEGIGSLPLDLFLIAVGHQAHRALERALG